MTSHQLDPLTSNTTGVDLEVRLRYIPSIQMLPSEDGTKNMSEAAEMIGMEEKLQELIQQNPYTYN